MQHPQENDTENCMRVDAIDSMVQEMFEEEISSKSEELSLMEELENVAAEKEECAENFIPTKPEKVKQEKPSKLELKPLPSSLKYAFLDDEETLPVVINSALEGKEEDGLLKVLREH
ncbi:hypothetical protein PIB30_090371 [Stylosanthes scabra]|uniref:Reverse transcriptase domain-containing protein n=1 Tax=Stylosanthes scabra TaxID=79078 RepID=A0ABU6UWW7_9FABA|nr:hypothetical protein [Stylosanthes scabra]